MPVKFQTPIRKKPNYRINYLDDASETAKKLKTSLNLYMNNDSQVNEQKITLFNCLNDMLSTAAITDDKHLQERQIQQVDKWFQQNLEVINFRTKPPLYQQNRHVKEKANNTENSSKSPRNSIMKVLGTHIAKEFTTPKKNAAQRQFINSKDIQKSAVRDQSQESLVLGQSPSGSRLSMSKKREENQTPQIQQAFSIVKKKVDLLNKTQSFMLSEYQFGTQDYLNQLNKMISESTTDSISRARMQQQIKNTLFDWQNQKRLRQSLKCYKNELLDNSNFQNLGVSLRSYAQTTMNHQKENKNKEQRIETQQITGGGSVFQDTLFDNRFLDIENDQDLRSDVSSEEVSEVQISQQQKSLLNNQFKASIKPKKIIDLTKDEIDNYPDLFNSPKKETNIQPAKPIKLPPELENMKLPPPPITVDQLRKQLNYSQQQVKNIESNHVHKIRMNRTNVIFKNQGNISKIDDFTGSSLQVDDMLNNSQLNTFYPMINQDKMNLDSAVLNTNASNDVITMSCFTRPLSNIRRKVNISRLPSINYNFKLLAKQNEKRLEELQEIESIKKELSKNDVPLGINILQRAIQYSNERAEEEVNDFGIRSSSMPSKQINYPNLGDLLLKNPFEKEKETKKGRKKKR
ncbi:UNKNOWN [Stylonychia lemnae]|uniref:Uncharacterized protein n=1 Tax=Stylonychia lemnae TaxID=5949 RepID=A0A078AJY9_STYLE|nr:UNKNOWN [Stylonychia lemnae]|eukprot:CDW82211.1 UNKNOWN [Stylonychia lemnae]